MPMPEDPLRIPPENVVPERHWMPTAGFMPGQRPAGRAKPQAGAPAPRPPDYPSVSPVLDEERQRILSSSERFEQHLAEIDRASALLRSALPDLEAWPSQAAENMSNTKPRPVWLVVSVLWISTLVVTAMATVAIAVLVS
jgi:hypothetical protein